MWHLSSKLGVVLLPPRWLKEDDRVTGILGPADPRKLSMVLSLSLSIFLLLVSHSRAVAVFLCCGLSPSLLA